uniref:Ig-like domain-containing protein n=2 Tax=Lepeophtheirus salmonis TaxID=72036 RepID=A0A0K2V8M6_LEPSM
MFFSMSQLLHVKSLTLLFSLSFLISDLPFSLCKRDDEDFDYGEEEMTGEVPRFVVHDETIMAKQYDDVSFNCEVDKLREYDIIFKEDPKSNKMISMGDKIILSEYLDRIKLVRLSEKRGMTLILKNVTTADTGIYTCLLNHPLKNNTVTFDLTVEEESVFSKISSEGVTGGGTSHLQEASFSSCLLILLNISFIFCFNLYSSLILY